MPVPPFPMPRMPATSVARLTSALVMTPATALRMPLRLPSVSEPDTTTLVDEAVPATTTSPAKVEVAVVDVAVKLLLVVLGTTIQVGSEGGQPGLRVCPGR